MPLCSEYTNGLPSARFFSLSYRSYQPVHQVDHHPGGFSLPNPPTKTRRINMKWACLALCDSALSPRLTGPETPSLPAPRFFFSEASARADTPLPPRCRGPLPIPPRPVFRFQPPSLRLSPPLLASVYSLPLQPLRELPGCCPAIPTLPRALSNLLRVAGPATRAVPGAAAASPSRWPLPLSPPLRVMSGT